MHTCIHDIVETWFYKTIYVYMHVYIREREVYTMVYTVYRSIYFSRVSFKKVSAISGTQIVMESISISLYKLLYIHSALFVNIFSSVQNGI